MGYVLRRTEKMFKKEKTMKSVTLIAINAKYCHTSLSVRSIGAYCREKGISVTTLEHTVNEPFRAIMRSVLAHKSDVFAFSCYLWNIETVRKICTDLKKILPKCEILLGGPEVSFDPEVYDFADAVISGEGEMTVAAYLAGEKMTDGALLNLDSLPFCYSDADLEENRHRLIYYEASRGCPYGCSFCLSSTEKGVRFKSIEKVCEELARFDAKKVDLVKFVDRTFNADRDRALRIWQFAAEKCTHTKFHFEIAGELIKDTDLEFLKTVPKGRFQFEIGIQSTNPETLRAVDRNADIPFLFDRIRKLSALGNIHIHTDLIAGLPYETYNRFKTSFNDVYALASDCLQLGFLKLLKGSKIRNEEKKHGYIYEEAAPYEIYENAYIEAEEIFRLEKVEDAVERFYNSHAFEKSIEHAVKRFSSPFDFYEAFSACFDGKTAVSRKNLYTYLYQFYTERFGTDSLFCEKLRFDWTKEMHTMTPPPFLGRHDTMQPLFFTLLETEGFKETYLPSMVAIKNKEIIKHAFIREFYLPERKVYLFCEDDVTDITNACPKDCKNEEFYFKSLQTFERT